MLLAPEIAPPDPMLPGRWRVVKTRKETNDVVTLTLEPLDGQPVPFAPGQFNMVYAFGVGEVPISISGGSANGGVQHTIRSVAAVTHALYTSRPGDVVGVRGPFGNGWDVESAAGNDLVIIGGGIGLAPLKPALERVLTQRDRFGHVVLLFGSRSPDDVLYRRELEAWRGRFDIEVAITVDYADASWRSHVGLVTKLIPRAPFHPDHTVTLLCGPEVMMRASARTLIERGVSPARIRLSMERNMKCAIGLCGHCQFGPTFICRDGPVLTYDQVAPLLQVWEV